MSGSPIWRHIQLSKTSTSEREHCIPCWSMQPPMMQPPILPQPFVAMPLLSNSSNVNYVTDPISDCWTTPTASPSSVYLPSPLHPRSSYSESTCPIFEPSCPTLTLNHSQPVQYTTFSCLFMYLVDDYLSISSYSEYLYLAPLYSNCTYLIAYLLW